MENDSTTVNVSVKELSKEQIYGLVQDKEFAKLKPGSDEYKAALNTKFGKKNEEASSADDSETDQATGSEDDDVSLETKSSNDKTKPETEKLSKGVQKRIDKLTARAKGQEEVNARLLAEIEALKNASGSKTTEEKPAATKSSEGKPKMEDFDDMDEYFDAKYEWNEKQKEVKTKELTAAEARQKTVGNWNTGVDAFEKANDLDAGDFAEAIKPIKFYKAAKEALVSSPHGHDVAWAVANDSDLKEKMEGLSALDQVKLIGRLEGRFEKKDTTPKTKKTITNAKQPSAAIPRGAGKSQVGIPDPKTDPVGFAEYSQKVFFKRK